jgi:hypothetical protein
MKQINRLLIVIILFAACKPSDNDIKALLQSKNIDDLIEGAYKAGESGKTEFIPYLLKNADDPSRSTQLNFKGFSVYQEKMIALSKILKIASPIKITRNPDSTVIRFYTEAGSKYINK